MGGPHLKVPTFRFSIHSVQSQHSNHRLHVEQLMTFVVVLLFLTSGMLAAATASISLQYLNRFDDSIFQLREWLQPNEFDEIVPKNFTGPFLTGRRILFSWSPLHMSPSLSRSLSLCLAVFLSPLTLSVSLFCFSLLISFSTLTLPAAVRTSIGRGHG